MANVGMVGLDWHERINWDRLRKYRLERARERMKAHGLGAMLLMYDENVRYVTSTLTPGWNRLKPGLRYAMLCGDDAPVLFEQGDIGMHIESQFQFGARVPDPANGAHRIGAHCTSSLHIKHNVLHRSFSSRQWTLFQLGSNTGDLLSEAMESDRGILRCCLHGNRHPATGRHTFQHSISSDCPARLKLVKESLRFGGHKRFHLHRDRKVFHMQSRFGDDVGISEGDSALTGDQCIAVTR